MTAASQIIGVYTTVSSQEEARRLARALVESGLAACAQISAIESFYGWDGAVQQEPEWRILFKTTDRRYADVEAAIRARHSYELPAIYAVEVAAVSGAYAEWVAQGSSGGKAPG